MSAAQAATLVAGSFTREMPGSGMNRPNAPPIQNDIKSPTAGNPQSIAKFDPTLGTLNGIYVSLMFDSISVTAESLTPGAYNLRTIFTYGQWNASPCCSMAPTFGQFVENKAVTLAARSNFLFGTAAGGSESGTIDPADFPSFIGTGDLALAFATSYQLDGPPSAGDYFISNQGAATFSFTYDYTPAIVTPPASQLPEPATWALMIVGLGATGVSLRRRRRDRAVPYRASPGADQHAPRSSLSVPRSS